MHIQLSACRSFLRNTPAGRAMGPSALQGELLILTISSYLLQACLVQRYGLPSSAEICLDSFWVLSGLALLLFVCFHASRC